MRAQQRACREVILPVGWAPYAVTGDAAGRVWMTVLTPSGLARMDPATALTGDEPGAGIVHEPFSAGRPMQLSIGADGSVWYTRTDDRLGWRDASGRHSLIDLPSGAAPYGIAVSPRGDIWCTAPGINQIGRVTAERALIMIDLPVPQAGAAMLTVEADGTAWAALNGAGALARVCGDAVEIVELPEGAAPVGVTASRSGIWYADIAGGCVGRIAPSGDLEQIRFADAACRPHAVAADGDGCWVTLWGSGELAHVTPGGDVHVQKLPGREPHGLWVSASHVWVAMESGSLAVAERHTAA
jgi:virginiamycin B lyase